MINAALNEAYGALLRACVFDPDEDDLKKAADLGRQLIGAQVSAEEIIDPRLTAEITRRF